MKLDVQSKNLLPSNLYATGIFASIIDSAKYYNGVPTKSTTTSTTPIKNTAVVTTPAKATMFLFYRAYTKGQQSSEIKILQNFLHDQ